MQACETCGNTYDNCFTIQLNGRTHTFDCFECAIQGLAPVCSQCHCKIIGHGMEDNQTMYCCAHCAKKAGNKGFKDREGA